MFVAFAASQLRPVFHKAGELREKIELPVLGVISMILTDGDRRRERVDRTRFIVASGTLLGAFTVVQIATTYLAR